MKERSLRRCFGENLQERVNFNSLKNTVNYVRITAGEVFSLFACLKL